MYELYENYDKNVWRQNSMVYKRLQNNQQQPTNNDWYRHHNLNNSSNSVSDMASYTSINKSNGNKMKQQLWGVLWGRFAAFLGRRASCEWWFLGVVKYLLQFFLFFIFIIFTVGPFPWGRAGWWRNGPDPRWLQNEKNKLHLYQDSILNFFNLIKLDHLILSSRMLHIVIYWRDLILIKLYILVINLQNDSIWYVCVFTVY